MDQPRDPDTAAGNPAADRPPEQSGDAAPPDSAAAHRNEVVLVGRVTAEPAQRTLADGTEIVTWRMAVTRPVAEQRRHVTADAVNCVSFDPTVHQRTREWRRNDVVQVSGALRRRFWRTASGVASLYEVEARDARAAPARQ